MTFEEPANVNRLLRGQTACDDTFGEFCTPVLFYDGSERYCLLYTERDLTR